jgi:phosphoribosylamine---glycine ligase
MKVLVIGSGGREHALLWKLRQDAPAAELYIARGNGGTDALATPVSLDGTDIPALAAWARRHDVGLTVVGPEAPLAEGIVDRFQNDGLAIFGPTRAASDIEASKSFAKSLMKDAGVPTAEYDCFTDSQKAERYIRQRGAPIVVKASGLAAGKGAVVCESIEDAVATARALLNGELLGAAGHEIVVEECLRGEELSVLALTDGEHALPLVPAQDHKRLGEGDRGPNTGGMGAYAPVSIATTDLLQRVQSEILLPTLAALRERKRTFRGTLYAGLMLTESGPKVIEFNARFGDPETEVVLPLVATNLLELMLAVAQGESIAGQALDTRPAAALTTVLASAGYPETPEKGKPISIPGWIEDAADVMVFHAGTKRVNDQIVSAGGRVLAVTAVAPTLQQAAERSRAAAEAIDFPGKLFRRDIGWRELARARAAT